MPAHKNEPKSYFNITSGKFRQKVDATTPDARSRETKKGKTIYEIVYDSIEGKVASMYFKEDQGFGNSFEVTIDDGKEKFQISFKEGDNSFNDFFSKLPNVDLSQWVKLAPYSFEDKEKSRRGLTVWQDDEKIANYFVTKQTDGTFEYNYGFPKPEDAVMDKESWKIYFIKVTKFLRAFIKDVLMPKLQNTKDNSESEDLPF